MNFRVPEKLNSYVPDVYQKNINEINYGILARKGIRLLSFDLNGTLAQKSVSKPSKKLKFLFEYLKKEGFKCVLLSNKDKERTKKFANKLDVPYIFSHDKTRREHFQRALDMYAVEGIVKSQMAHVGNDLVVDIFNGHQFGIITCLVNKAYVRKKQEHTIWNLPSFPNTNAEQTNSKKTKLEKKLKEYTLWRRHHMYKKNDQYYQLGEEPPYIAGLIERRYCSE